MKNNKISFKRIFLFIIIPAVLIIITAFILVPRLKINLKKTVQELIPVDKERFIISMRDKNDNYYFKCLSLKNKKTLWNIKLPFKAKENYLKYASYSDYYFIDDSRLIYRILSWDISYGYDKAKIMFDRTVSIDIEKGAVQWINDKIRANMQDKIFHTFSIFENGMTFIIFKSSISKVETVISAIDSKTGKDLWVSEIDSSIAIPLTANNHIILHAVSEGKFFILDKKNGEIFSSNCDGYGFVHDNSYYYKDKKSGINMTNQANALNLDTMKITKIGNLPFDPFKFAYNDKMIISFFGKDPFVNEDNASKQANTGMLCSYAVDSGKKLWECPLGDYYMLDAAGLQGTYVSPSASSFYCFNERYIPLILKKPDGDGGLLIKFCVLDTENGRLISESNAKKYKNFVLFNSVLIDNKYYFKFWDVPMHSDIILVFDPNKGSFTHAYRITGERLDKSFGIILPDGNLDKKIKNDILYLDEPLLIGIDAGKILYSQGWYKVHDVMESVRSEWGL